MNTKHRIGIQEEGTRFKATVVDLSIVVYGDTPKEAVRKAEEAIIAAHIQVLQEDKPACSNHQVA
jgi:hypothetical protein